MTDSLIDGADPYLIAEIGVNHFDIAEKRDISPIDAAKEMVKEAAEAGVNAVKFQSYSADSLASKHSPAYWDTDEESTESQYELFAEYDNFGSEEFKEIARWSESNCDVDFLSTPFDQYAVEYLDDLVPAYKIASADLTNIPLIKSISAKEKPILLSTGASTIGEISDAVETIEAHIADPEIYLLHCILEYPTTPKNANLGMIQHIDSLYPEYTAGYSDHVPPDSGMVTLLNAFVKGADVIEKHFTLDKSLSGNDHYHAMDPSDIRTFRDHIETFETTSGQYRKQPISVEADSRKYARRSIVATENIAAGEQISRGQVTMKRPGTGIPPKLVDIIVGRTAQTDIESDDILTWEMV